eukprot:6476788-Amphidinium_carterae.1
MGRDRSDSRDNGRLHSCASTVSHHISCAPPPPCSKLAKDKSHGTLPEITSKNYDGILFLASE